MATAAPMRGVSNSARSSGRNMKARATAPASQAIVAMVARTKGVREAGRWCSACSICPTLARSSLAGRGGVSSGCQVGCGGSSRCSSPSVRAGVSAPLAWDGDFTAGALSPSPSLSAASMAFRVSAIGSSDFWGLFAIVVVASFKRQTVAAARLGPNLGAAPRARGTWRAGVLVPCRRLRHPIGSATRKKPVRSRLSHHR